MASPYDVPHTGSDLKELATAIKKLRGETRVVMEAMGNYYEPIARFLHEQGVYVSVVNPMLISDFGGNTLRKPKTDKKDAVKLTLYTRQYAATAAVTDKSSWIFSSIQLHSAKSSYSEFPNNCLTFSKKTSIIKLDLKFLGGALCTSNAFSKMKL